MFSALKLSDSLRTGPEWKLKNGTFLAHVNTPLDLDLRLDLDLSLDLDLVSDLLAWNPCCTRKNASFVRNHGLLATTYCYDSFKKVPKISSGQDVQAFFFLVKSWEREKIKASNSATDT